MTKGKIVLGLATAILSTGAALAYKANKLVTKRVYGWTTNFSACKQCASIWTKSIGGCAHNCHTQSGIIFNGNTLYATGARACTWYTKPNCTGKVTRVTTTQ